MSDCPHEIWERESDVTADGSCPICLRDEIERLRAQLTEAAAFHGHKLEQIAAFLDKQANLMDAGLNRSINRQAAADCRAMVRKLRGET